MGENRVIGAEGDLPWYLPKDLKRFKEKTIGHPVIMGRKTFNSLGGKPLKNRTNIILTRRKDFKVEGAKVVSSIDDAIEIASETDPNEIFIIGGGEIYKATLSITDKIYLTIVHSSFEGDTFFPEIDEQEWQTTEDEYFEADEKHSHSFTFRTLERKKA